MRKILKKTIFYLPAAIFTLWTLCLNVLTGRLIPLWHIWNCLHWLSGWLLSRGKGWGCIFGLMPAAMVLAMNWGEPGGVAFLTGLVWAVFYTVSGLWVFRKEKK